jgi:ABC-2 type transport system ATP-binding protein
VSIIEVRELQKCYGDKVAVSEVSFEVAEGEIFGILGPNGAGKTTTVECIAGLRERDGGCISVLGLDPGREQEQLRELLGMQLQESALPEKLRVREALELYASFYRHPADWRELVNTLGLESTLGQRYGKLSGGQKQRLSIALALIGGPRVAVLDELTTGLDPGARRDTWALIERVRDSGVTVLLVTHFMEEAERLCDRVALIDGGRTVAVDTPAGLRARAGSRTELRFRPSVPFDHELLLVLPEVESVRAYGDQLTVRGTGELPSAVIVTLARAGVIAEGLRVQQSSLEDAFVALTDHAGSPERLATAGH